MPQKLNISVCLDDLYAHAERKVIYVGNGRTGEPVEKQQEKSDTGTPF